MASLVCGNCHQPMRPGDAFCEKCGGRPVVQDGLPLQLAVPAGAAGLPQYPVEGSSPAPPGGLPAFPVSAPAAYAPQAAVPQFAAAPTYSQAPVDQKMDGPEARYVTRKTLYRQTAHALRIIFAAPPHIYKRPDPCCKLDCCLRCCVSLATCRCPTCACCGKPEDVPIDVPESTYTWLMENRIEWNRPGVLYDPALHRNKIVDSINVLHLDSFNTIVNASPVDTCCSCGAAEKIKAIIGESVAFYNTGMTCTCCCGGCKTVTPVAYVGNLQNAKEFMDQIQAQKQRLDTASGGYPRPFAYEVHERMPAGRQWQMMRGVQM